MIHIHNGRPSVADAGKIAGLAILAWLGLGLILTVIFGALG